MALNYTTVAVLKTRLGITVVTYDTILNAVLTGVEASVNTYLGFDPSTSSFTEYLTTRGHWEVAAKRVIATVSSLYLDEQGNFGLTSGSFASETLQTAGTDYVLDANRGTLRRLGRPWPYRLDRQNYQSITGVPSDCPGCLKLAYTTDNAAVVAVAAEAGYLEAAVRWKAQKHGVGMVLSEGMDGASLTVSQFPRNASRIDPSDSFISPFVASMLNPFRIGRIF